jgi:DNA mismatch endonuclease, patch repair protein
MRAVRSRDTGPEWVVRRRAHALGYRYRLHRRDLPGCPDLVFPSRRLALFVHGCFWHGHSCPRGARVPKSQRDYWLSKIARNRARHEQVVEALAAIGWTPAVIWECETRHPQDIDARLIALLERFGAGTA